MARINHSFTHSESLSSIKMQDYDLSTIFAGR